MQSSTTPLGMEIDTNAIIDSAYWSSAYAVLFKLAVAWELAFVFI